MQQGNSICFCREMVNRELSRKKICTPRHFTQQSRSRAATDSASTVNTSLTSCSVCRSRGQVVPFPILLICSLSLIFRTGDVSIPLAKNHRISPHFPNLRRKMATSVRARSPMVLTAISSSCRAVDLPTYSRSPTGSGHTISLKCSKGITVVASGFFKSLPSLAKILLKDTPTLTVTPSSSFTRRRMVSAIVTGSLCRQDREPVRSIQFSSSPKASTWSEYS